MTRPGYLGTPMSSGKSPEQQGDLIAALLDKLGIAKAGVIAVSGGGPSAVRFGLHHSDRCAGLVLVSTCADKVDTPIPFSFKVMKFLARWPWFVKQFRKKAERDLITVAKRSIRDPEILIEVHAKMYETRVPNAELLAVDGGEHVAIFTHRNMVREKVIEFMQRHFTA